ncbi:MAG: alpha-1,2-fucosyltransferase [Chitinophagaceae bacterium]|nr:alpha-1,2-fucosyltransferase [Chitinophagaceae bacterium]
MAETKDKKSPLIIEVAGGLGNQMFQYAFFLKLKSLGYPCKLYYDKTQKKHKGYELDKVFGINEQFATESELNKVLGKDTSFVSRLKRKWTGYHPSFYWEHDKGYAYKPEIFNQAKPIYLQGCWLSEKYFEDIDAEVRKVFVFRSCSNQSSALADKIRDDSSSVSIHLRRGDYLQSDIHLKLDYPKYLTGAIRKIKTGVENPSLYIFSDDMDHTKKLFSDNTINGFPLHFVDWNSGEDSWQDMYLMSLCRHNIICNSTFSWWAAWLNKNPDKMVVCPEKWFTTDFLNDNDIVPEGWIQI